MTESLIPMQVSDIRLGCHGLKAYNAAARARHYERYIDAEIRKVATRFWFPKVLTREEAWARLTSSPEACMDLSLSEPTYREVDYDTALKHCSGDVVLVKASDAELIGRGLDFARRMDRSIKHEKDTPQKPIL